MLITTHDQLDIQFAYFCESNYYLVDRRHVHSYASSRPSCTPQKCNNRSIIITLCSWAGWLLHCLSGGKERIITQSSSGLQIKSRRVFTYLHWVISYLPARRHSRAFHGSRQVVAVVAVKLHFPTSDRAIKSLLLPSSYLRSYIIPTSKCNCISGGGESMKSEIANIELLFLLLFL